MKIFIIFLFPFFVVTYFFTFSLPVLAKNWQYPLDKTLERPSYKTFGQYFDKNYYINKENLFPNQYVGYHVGTDLEIFPQELDANVPVFAMGDGVISFIGPILGYGGLILEKLTSENLTVLYGHLKLSSSNLKVGDYVQTGQTLTFLGNAFSSETGGERKHLHFGIYQGQDLYFKGYENTISKLDQKWINPLHFLQTRVIITTPIAALTTIPTAISQNAQENTNFFQKLWNWIEKLLKGF